MAFAYPAHNDSLITSSPPSYSPIQIQSVSPTPGLRASNQKLLTSLIAASAVLGIILLLLFIFYIIHRRKHKWRKTQQKNDYRKRSVTVMDYRTLELSTDNFGDGNILGSGGFGCVYRGKLEGDHYVAVKRLSTVLGTKDDAVKEFQTEVDLLSKIHHPNIITLLGYSVHAETRLLVYELMQNGSLETQLHGASRGSGLTWHLRMKIALDVARGLEYLHEHCHPQVIHRDLKSSNILLDSNFNAKLSDFGLAVLNGPQNKNNIKLSGTLGYVAPEYLLDGKLTEKSDVYGFGVVLLELLLGKKPMEKVATTATQCQTIVTWAMPQLTDRTKLPNIVDPVIRNSMDLKHLYQVAAVAVLCVQPEPSYRPLITDILHSLVPLVPVELGGTLRNSVTVATTTISPES